MAQINIDLGRVDYEKLVTDADIQCEARRLLPGAMQKMGEAVAEVAWKELKKAFGTKDSEKTKFIRETASEYAKNSKNKKEVEDYIIGQLNDGKRKH